MIELSIVIVNYNLTKELYDCISSLNMHLQNIDYEIIVVDNNTSEPLFEEFKRNFRNLSSVTLYCLDENVGFGRACNVGISKSCGEFICFFNPDASINEDIFTPLLNRLRSDQQIAILGPRINESHYLDYSAGFQPNVTIEILNVIYIGRYLEALLIFLSSEARAGHCLEVGWVLGACMVVRSSVLDKLSGFDSDYFMFYEEVDLCRRALEYGYKVYYLNSVSVSHIGSVSVKRDYETFTRYFYSSKRLFIDKHFHGVTKCLMSSLLTAQSVTQLILWILLLPVYGDKSRKKISAHCELLTGKALIS